MDVAEVEGKLAGLREGFVADGYDLLVDEVSQGNVRVRIVAGPSACEGCLVPKNIVVEMLKAALNDDPGIHGVDVAYPGE